MLPHQQRKRLKTKINTLKMKSWKPIILIVFVLLLGWGFILNRSARNKIELNRLESSYETLKEVYDSNCIKNTNFSNDTSQYDYVEFFSYQK